MWDGTSLNFNGDVGANYATFYEDRDELGMTAGTQDPGTSVLGTMLPAFDAGAGSFGTMDIYIDYYAWAHFQKSIRAVGVAWNSAHRYMGRTNGIWRDFNAINAITIKTNANTPDEGFGINSRFTLYGII